MKLTRPERLLRTARFKTNERNQTKGISIGYTNTIADPRICAIDLDGIDCMTGAFGINYHYVVMTTGEVQLGRDPMTIATRGRFKEQQDNLWIAIVGGCDPEGNHTSTITPEQRDAVEWLIQSIANVLQVELEITDYVENRTLRDERVAAEELEELREEEMDAQEARAIF